MSIFRKMQVRPLRRPAALGEKVLLVSAECRDSIISVDGRVAPGSFTPRPSRPGESHPEALTDPCLSLSAHTARAIHGELALSVTTRRFLPLPVDQSEYDANDPPPSLHGHYPISSLLRSSPPLAGASVLWASRFVRLHLLP